MEQLRGEERLEQRLGSSERIKGRVGAMDALAGQQAETAHVSACVVCKGHTGRRGCAQHLGAPAGQRISERAEAQGRHAYRYVVC